ncbi:MAG TPA: HAD-IA family hydrolase [Roseiflexaceae bacterium]|nr:HAD-IA family hydrolase [Roseiflexaceae bacterium]
MRFNGAIFDVDGVLVDSPHEHAWRDALQRLMRAAWTDLAGQTRYAPEKFTTEVYQAYVAGKPREAGARAALEYFGIPDPDGQRVAEYMAVKQADLIALIERGQFTAFEDALRFLLDLKAAGVRIAAASSSKNADIFLRKVSLAKWAGGEGQPYPFLTPNSTLREMFDADVCGRDFARGKPDPEIFLTAAAELGLPPEQCVVIEDAQSGVQAAKAGGMACIGVARLDDAALLRSAGADWVVTSLDELPVTALEG